MGSESIQEALVEIVKERLLGGSSIEIPGLGTFDTIRNAAEFHEADADTSSDVSDRDISSVSPPRVVIRFTPADASTGGL